MWRRELSATQRWPATRTGSDLNSSAMSGSGSWLKRWPRLARKPLPMRGDFRRRRLEIGQSLWTQTAMTSLSTADTVAMQQRCSPELEPILDQARADSDRANRESGLLLRHTRRIGEGCVPDTTPEQLAEDIATARDLLPDTSKWTHSTLEAAAAVAASTLEAQFGHGQAVPGTDLRWSADVLLKVADAAQSHESDAASLSGPLLDMGPGVLGGEGAAVSAAAGCIGSASRPCAEIRTRLQALDCRKRRARRPSDGGGSPRVRSKPRQHLGFAMQFQIVGEMPPQGRPQDRASLISGLRGWTPPQ